MEALMPLEKLPTNSKTREFPRSATQTLPEESTATAAGLLRLLAVVPAAVPAKLIWPKTTDATWPVEKGGANSRTRLFPESVTQRFPAGSKASARGAFNPL
jgi:hypothetical protein